MFLARYDTNGNVVWATSAGGAGSDSGAAVVVDSTGFLCVAGTFNGEATFGRTNITSAGQNDAYLAKYSQDGCIIWVRRLGGSYNDSARSVTADAAGNCYVVGSFQGTANFGPFELTANGGTDSFVAKLDRNGNVLWAKRAGGVSAESAEAMAVDSRGDSVVAGSFTDGAAFDSTILFGAGMEDAFVAKLATSLPDPPVVVRHPQSVSVPAGIPVAFTVTVAGTSPFSYQWRFEGTNLPGATNASLILNSVQAGSSGQYSVVVANAAGVVTSAVATLSVRLTLSISTDGSGQAAAIPAQPFYLAGDAVSLTAMPAPSNSFTHWSGDASGSSNPLIILMDARKQITAHFTNAVPLILATQGEGTLDPSPARAFYRAGEGVTITAVAARWFAFSRWNDGDIHNPRVVTIGPSNSYTAIFTPTQALETVTFGGVMRTAPVGMPAVFVEDVFIVAGAVTNFGSARVEIRTSITNATILFTLDGTAPGFGSTFYERPFDLRQSARLRAVAFNANLTQSVASDPVDIFIVPSHTLAVATAGGGTVARSPDTAQYAAGSPVVVTATPNPGWSFLQWLGDASGTNPVASVALTRDKCVEAVFGTTLSTAVLGNGSILVRPVTAIYPYGTVARLTAVPQPGNYFAFWASAGTGTNNPLSWVVTNAQATVTAVFQPLTGGQASLAVLVDGFGTVTINPRGNRFNSGATVTLLAIPDAGQQFLAWGGDASGAQNPLIMVMNASKVVTAQFTKRPRLSFAPCTDAGSGDPLALWLTGEWGAAYDIECAPILPEWWARLLTVTNQFGRTQFLVPGATNEAQRFYRAVGE